MEVFRNMNRGIFGSLSEFALTARSPIGTGSSGTVFKAKHIKSQQIYAIKKIRMTNQTAMTELLPIRQEIELQFQLDHPNVVKLVDVLVNFQGVYLILEWVAGGNLFQFCRRNRLTETEAAKYWIGTLDAVEYLHEKGFYHRDIKPQNILITKDGNAKLCDFGWATLTTRKKRNTFCGTFEYMAPQMLFENCYDSRIDIWALGILLYELLHQSSPFPGMSLDQIKGKITKGRLKMSKSVSLEAVNLISMILQVIPSQRPILKQISMHPWVQRHKIPAIDRAQQGHMRALKHRRLQSLGRNVTEKNDEIPLLQSTNMPQIYRIRKRRQKSQIDLRFVQTNHA